MVEQNIVKQEKDLHDEESSGKPGTPDKRAALVSQPVSPL
jgi:hypothetical protein